MSNTKIVDETKLPSKSKTEPTSTVEWKVNWCETATEKQKESWKFAKPQFKYCKKRKEFFSENFFDVWYKAPYKYHMLLKAQNLGEANILASLDICYEDEQKINSKEECISKTENYFVATSEKEFEVKLGSFQFNVCSYKHDGRKFRLIVKIFISGQENPVCEMISPSFVIKAKKPISKPGIKTKKRKRQEMAAMEQQNKFLVLPQYSQLKRPKIEIPQIPIKNEFFAPIPPYPYNVQPQTAVPATFDVLENLRSNEVDFVDTSAQLDLEDYVQNFDQSATIPSEMVQPVKPPVEAPSLYRVDSVLSAFETMSTKERKQTICRLIEKCHEYEKEFLNRRYFNAALAVNNANAMLAQQNFMFQQGIPFLDTMQSANIAQYFT